ncbi:24661_t:CDS:2 [Entrophospora sp. SA101]|nr:24661_t:CDS:2 [Entrophospora sp. SA101]
MICCWKELSVVTAVVTVVMMGVEDESSKQEQQLKTQNGSSITQLGALEDDEFEEFNAEGS